MPQLIKYTDEKCIEMDRTILFVNFDYDYLENDLREETPYIKETLEFFKNNDIGYELIGPFSNSGILGGYFARYYIDVPYETTNEKYKIIEEYFENSNSSMKDPKKLFAYCVLEDCTRIYAESKAIWDELYN